VHPRLALPLGEVRAEGVDVDVDEVDEEAEAASGSAPIVTKIKTSVYEV
jgi:hypothetical protein